MRLLGEIFEKIDEEGFSRCTLLLGGAAYLEGVKTVGDFSPEKIVVFFKKYALEIEGQDLFIRKYVDGDLLLNGKVLSLRVLSENGGRYV